MEGEQTREDALRRYAAVSASHRRKFELMLLAQRVLPRIAPPLLHRTISAMRAKRFVDWSFTHYLNIAHPSFSAAGAPQPAPLRVAA